MDNWTEPNEKGIEFSVDFALTEGLTKYAKKHLGNNYKVLATRKLNGDIFDHTYILMLHNEVIYTHTSFESISSKIDRLKVMNRWTNTHNAS